MPLCTLKSNVASNGITRSNSQDTRKQDRVQGELASENLTVALVISFWRLIGARLLNEMRLQLNQHSYP